MSRCIRVSYTGVFLVDSNGIVTIFITRFMYSYIPRVSIIRQKLKNTKLLKMNIRFLKSLTEILHTETNLLRNMKSFSEYY